MPGTDPREAARIVAGQKDAEIDALKRELETAAETGNGVAEYQRRAEKAEAEVIRLKAKLYDYMTAGA